MSDTDIHLVSRYADHQRVLGFSRRTVARRCWSLGLWAAYLADHQATLATATVEHLEGFLARWPAAQSRYSVRSDVAMFYRFALRRGHLHCADPTALLDPPKVPKRRATPIPAADVRRLLGDLTSSDRLIVMLAVYAGLRVSEIAAFRGEHVDLEGRWLTVFGKGGREDVVPVAAPLAAELACWPRRGRLAGYHNGASVGGRIRVLLRRHGIAGRPHDLRHSFANAAMVSSHDNIVVVQRLMRHAEVATTMRYLRPDRVGHDVVDRLYDDAA